MSAESFRGMVQRDATALRLSSIESATLRGPLLLIVIVWESFDYVRRVLRNKTVV